MIFFLLFLSILVAAGKDKDRLGFCIVFKNEAPFIQEWLAFHLTVGVDHFLLYDNESTDKIKDKIKPFADKITYQKWPSQKRGKQEWTQCSAYDDCLKRFGPDFEWLAFIDVDEFLFPTNRSAPSQLLPDLLREEFAEFDGLVVRNALFGSSGFVERPRGLVTENYVFRAPLAHPTYQDAEDDVLFHVKSVVRPGKVVKCGKFGAHVFEMKEGAVLVNERKERHQIQGKHTPKGKAYTDKLRYNHYKAKSRHDWQEKKDKGTVQGAEAQKKFAKWGNHWPNVDRNDVLDTSIFRFLPQVRKMLNLTQGKYPVG